jgi:hypothetical protein
LSFNLLINFYTYLLQSSTSMYEKSYVTHNFVRNYKNNTHAYHTDCTVVLSQVLFTRAHSPQGTPGPCDKVTFLSQYACFIGLICQELCVFSPFAINQCCRLLSLLDRFYLIYFWDCFLSRQVLHTYANFLNITYAICESFFA